MPMTTTSSKPTLVVIVGPTGSGKTAVSIELARRLGAPIISTDSRQFYQGLAIGTAQPTTEELAAATHYFIADRPITEPLSAGEYEREALLLLDKLFKEHPFVIAVGGSGLYVDALCYGFDELPTADEELRATLTARLASEGLESLVEELHKLDPEYWEVVDRSNPARVMRALEVCMASGKPYSAQRSGKRTERPFRMVRIGVDMPRDVLYDRINRRVDMMMEAGLEAEARAVWPHKHLNALQTVGYKELFDYFEGNCTLTEAVELIKRNSRRYAKRQLTWFRRHEQTHWLSPTEIEEVIRIIQNE